MRILGIDYGDKRIGIALSDPMSIIAMPFATYTKVDEKTDTDYFLKLIADNDVGKIVVGLPKNMDGSEGNRVLITKQFAKSLSAFTDIPIVFKDERLSSVSANKVLDESKMHWSKRKQVVDQIAAQIILQSYLDMR